LLFAAIFIFIKFKQYERQELLSTLILTLNRYKSMHGGYPADLSETIAKDADWLYYKPDSTRKSFYMPYSSGIMNCNTFRYNSSNGRWEEEFNY
jgi:hypothetical protein